MYLLDSDSASLAFRGHQNITARIDRTAAAVWLSGIAAEEMVQGVLARTGRARSRPGPGAEAASRLFVEMLGYLSRRPILPYTDQADSLFRSWPNAVRRVGANDCRIAASAIVHGYTVVTCNGKDFSRIPGVTFEDWSS